MEINDAEALELTYDLVATTMQSHDLDYMLSRYMHRVVHILDAQAALVRVVRSGELMLVDSTGLKPESEFLRPRIALSDFRESITFDKADGGVFSHRGGQPGTAARRRCTRTARRR